MPGDEQVRHCGRCRQNVYNVASLTRAEAVRLVGARACLRIYRRPDDTVLTSDCRDRLRAARKKGLLIFAGTLVIVLWAQVCAQFVGMMGLKRLLGSGGATMGAPVAMPPGQLVPRMPIPVHIMGVPPMPTMGEPVPVPPPTTPKHPTLGRSSHRTKDGAVKGKIAIRGLED
jgi:hypothetical protein